MLSLVKFRRAFGNGAFWRSALALALPIALQNLLVSSFSLVDTIMLGSLGDIALSSVGMAGQWSWLLNLVLFGFNSGASVFFSQYWGVRDIGRIRNVFGIQLLNVFSAAAVFTAVGLLLPREVVSIFNSDPAIIETGASYLRIAAFSYIAIALSNAFGTLLRSTENVRLPMISSIVSVAANALLNYILIYGKLGLPALGVRGAAIATCISSWLSPLIILGYTFLRPTIMRFHPREMLRGLSARFIGEYYRISLPVLINESMWGLGTVCYNIIFGRMGYEYYSAVTIQRTVENVFFSFFIGLCGACTIFVGKSVGAGLFVKAKTDARRFIYAMPALAAVVIVFVVFARAPLVRLFNMSGNLAETTDQNAQLILIIYASELMLRLIPYMTIVGIFRSGGDTLRGMIYDFTCLWLFSLPLTFVAAFVLHLPFPVVFAVMLYAEDIIKVFLCIHHFRSGKWVRPVTLAGSGKDSGKSIC